MNPAKTTPHDMYLAAQHLGGLAAAPDKLPVAFTLNGSPFSGIPSAKSTWQLIDANIARREFRGRVGELAIEAECLEYRDFPVVEWTVRMTNVSQTDSPVIGGFQALNTCLPCGNAVLYRNTGDYYSRDGLETFEVPLKTAGKIELHPNGGRSCDGALPYFRLCGDEICYVLSVGWPGQWLASFEQKGGAVELKAGQQYFNTLLHPGESVRSPRITMMVSEGGCERSVNIWRRWYFAHVLPRTDGAPMKPVMCGSNGEGGEEFTLADTGNQLLAINKFIERGLKPEVWWLDAGWYPCYSDDEGVRHWWFTGDWRPDPERFPDGFAPHGELCEKNGIYPLVWFEPERVVKKYWPKDMPDDYLLRRRDRMDEKDNSLLNLADERVFNWLVERVDGIIKQGHLRIYRQDFNFEPLQYWLDNDGGGDRLGITENLHTQAYLRYWDTLLERNPGLIIDSCASGGRRNDLEAMRRSVPLHPTDFGYGDHPVKQLFSAAWHTWTPYFRLVNTSCDDADGNYCTAESPHGSCDNFALHNAFSPVISCPVAYNSPESSFEYARRFRKLWERAIPYQLDGNFYLLTPVRKDSRDFFAQQFCREDGSGIVQVIANVKSGDGGVTVSLREMEPLSVYTFESPEFGRCFEITGAEAEKLHLDLKQRSGEIWFYRKNN